MYNLCGIDLAKRGTHRIAISIPKWCGQGSYCQSVNWKKTHLTEFLSTLLIYIQGMHCAYRLEILANTLQRERPACHEGIWFGSPLLGCDETRGQTAAAYDQHVCNLLVKKSNPASPTSVGWACAAPPPLQLLKLQRREERDGLWLYDDRLPSLGLSTLCCLD